MDSKPVEDKLAAMFRRRVGRDPSPQELERAKTRVEVAQWNLDVDKRKAQREERRRLQGGIR